jgi:hypothetical protein
MTSVNDDLMATSGATRRGLATSTNLRGPLAMVAAIVQVHALASMTGGGHAVSGTVTTVGVAEACNATGGG